jgi:hypothetical protein
MESTHQLASRTTQVVTLPGGSMNDPSVKSANSFQCSNCGHTPAFSKAVKEADRPAPPIGTGRSERRLLIRGEVLVLLHLNDEQLQQLINTRQLTPFLITGEERFDSRDVYRLIESYMTTASRRQL